MSPSVWTDEIGAAIRPRIRIGIAPALQGDVILARREGVIIMPAHLAEEVVTAEVVALKDEFDHLRLREIDYALGEIDLPWSAAIKAEFFRFIRARPVRPWIIDLEIEKRL
jgi:hypothetical protein